MNSTMRKGMFGLDEGADYEGYVIDGNLWNGWHNPYFTRESIEAIIADNVGDNYFPKMELTEAGLVVDERQYAPEDADEALYTIEGVDTPHGTLYPLGYYSWCWSEAL